jgi:dephospho-CoA kinase
VPRPLAVAVTGGIGAGKSEALKAFARHGAAVLSSDEVVHRLLREDADVRAAVIEHFGSGVLDERGEVDRAALARIVFADRNELAWLEALLHPRVLREYVAWRDALTRRPKPPAICAVEVPLLYEAGAEGRFDAVVTITAPAGVRHGRANVSPEEREGRLLPDEEKVRRADYAFVNDGSLAELDAFVASVVHDLGTRA